MKREKFHLVVIGGGSGGLVSAAGAAGLGVRVALIEKHAMGGDCLNTGCVPSKALIRSAKVIYDARTAARFGLPPHRFDIQLDSVLASVREVQANLARHDSVERFTSLGVARVGLNESEAKQKNVAHDIYSCSLGDLDRAVCDREAEGFIKVLTRKGSDRILGVTLVGSHAGDLLHELALAMHQGIGLKEVSAMIHVYPTLAEVSKRVADVYQRTRLTGGAKRWLGRYFWWRFG